MHTFDLEPGDTLIIDGFITLQYFGVNKNGQHKFGITADKSIAIHRKEVKERIDAEIPKRAIPYRYCFE